MRLEIVPDPTALAARAADRIVAAVTAAPAAVLGLPTGNTVIETYAELERRVQTGDAGFTTAAAYAVDEFAGVPPSTPGTNSTFFRERLRIPLPRYLPDPMAADLDAEIRSFAETIRAAGGFDLCVLGIGRNGHIAFNEPGSPRGSRARCVDLTPASRHAHAATFGSLDAVPHRGITLGVADLLEARSILVLASGADKAAIVARAIEGPLTAGVPASWLREHADLTWLLDDDAASQLRERSRP